MRILHILKWLFIVFVVLVVGLIGFVQLTWDKKFDVPMPDVKASSDSAVIARGRYLAYGPGHCASCHTPMDQLQEVDKGAQIPLSGGWELTIDPGTFRAPNLTPDKETGIGQISDGQLARALRYSIGHKENFLFPFMPFQEMSDADVVAIISFLRSQPAVAHEVKPSELSFLGKALLALGALKPAGPKNTPPASVVIDSTKEYGEYVANRVANCVGCHTDRDLKTGAFTGKPFAGGFMMPADVFSKGYTFVTPNLTPDKETSVMSQWTEQGFIGRFRSGRVHPTSPMPWGCFSRMNDVELKALYRYLTSLEPVSNKIEKTSYAPGEKLPK